MNACARALTGQKNSTVTDKMKKINQTGQRLLFNIPVFSIQNDVYAFFLSPLILRHSPRSFLPFFYFSFDFFFCKRARSLHASLISAFRAFLPYSRCVFRFFVWCMQFILYVPNGQCLWHPCSHASYANM